MVNNKQTIQKGSSSVRALGW